MKKIIVIIFVFSVLLSATDTYSTTTTDSKIKDFSIYIHPQYTNIKEHLGVYFGWDDQTVDDKYILDKNINVFSIDFSAGYKNSFFAKGHYSNTKGFKIGESENDFSNNWFDINYKFQLDEYYGVLVYYSRYSKKLDIPREITFDSKNSKYLIGVGASTYGLANINFSNFSKSGGHGIIYLGAGSFENTVWMSSTNPNKPRGIAGEWEFIAKNDFGFVFFMNMGALYNSNRFYIGGKLKVGGFFAGEVIVNNVDKTDEVITGTVAMEAVAGVNIIKNLKVGIHWKHNNENNRNESDEYDQDGSNFYNYITNVFLDFNFSF